MKGLVFTLLCLFSLNITAQNATVKGNVTDEEFGEPLFGVTIITADGEGTTTDIDGNFELKLSPGAYDLRFSYVGFEEQTRFINLKPNQTKEIKLVMGEEAQMMETVVVKAGKFTKKLEKEVVSIDVVTAEVIENNVATDLEDAVRTVPGLQVIDGQPSIRGGSGYAYGAGSRVIVVVDGMPMMTADRGDIKWDYISLETVEQLEVLKGASSVLYGASALNGVINVITKWPKAKPETSLSVYNKIFGAPKRNETKWWGTNRHETGSYISHLQRINKFDLVVGANLHQLSSWMDGDDEHRMRMTFKTRYRPGIDRLTLGINGNIMKSYEELYIIWADADNNILKPLGGNSPSFEFVNWNLDPWLTFFDKKDGKHSFKGRFYNTAQLLSNNERNVGNFAYADYSYYREFPHNFQMIAGTNFQSGFAKYRDNDRLSINTYAVYGQVEKKIKRLTLSAGFRGEMPVSELIEDLNFIPSFRFGANYAARGNNYFRASFGQGYRFPSYLELFVETEITSGIDLRKNPELQPEQGWSAEIGWKKAFEIKNFKNEFDIAGFWSEYQNMIEFGFGADLTGGLTDAEIGFQSTNIQKTRIAGLEVSWNTKGKIGKVPITTNIGYTYIYPVDLSSYTYTDSLEQALDTLIQNNSDAGYFLANMFRAFKSQPGDDELNDIMKYRFRHAVSGDIAVQLGEKFELGTSFNFYSHMENIDSVFLGQGSVPIDGGGQIYLTPGLLDLLIGRNEPIPGLTAWREENAGGNFILNVRAKYLFNDKITLQVGVENLFNREYSLRPAMLEPPRTYVMQFKMDF